MNLQYPKNRPEWCQNWFHSEIPFDRGAAPDVDDEEDLDTSLGAACVSQV